MYHFNESYTPANPGGTVLTVTQVNSYINMLLQGDRNLRLITICGEVSNVNFNQNGHVYFSLKEGKDTLKAVIFRDDKMKIPNLRDFLVMGARIVASGRITLFSMGGYHQFVVNTAMLDGEGLQSILLKQLYEKLDKEGLFDRAHKKPLPPFPETIGVITAPTGAALRDIRNAIERRYPCAEIVLAPVMVQGEYAAPSLVDAVNRFSSSRCVDVIIIGRGGGSAEDLWAFNDESLARAIYACEIPIISGVGHERDHTICDYVCDVAATTPTAAAELAVPEVTELFNTLEFFGNRAVSLSENLYRTLEKNFEHTSQLMEARSPSFAVNRYEEWIASLSRRAASAAKTGYNTAVSLTVKLSAQAEALSPLAVLNRGYSFITADGKNISSVMQVSSGDTLDIRLSDGEIKATVK